MSAKPTAKPLLALAMLFLAACGPKAEISDRGKVAGAGPPAEMTRLINLQRGKAGLAPLVVDERVATAAAAHAGAMARDACVDFDCGGGEAAARLGAAGYRAQRTQFYVSAGKPAPEDMIREMMALDWGRDIVLDPAYRHVAAGYVASDTVYRHYWAIGFAAPAVEDLTVLSAEMARLVNIERKKHGAPALAMNRELGKSAQAHALFMAENDCFAHRCPNEPYLGKRARDAGYDWRAVAENIAAGQADVAEVVAGWMTSPGHAKNILNPRYREIGIGYVLLDRDGGEVALRHYWVQNFGLR